MSYRIMHINNDGACYDQREWEDKQEAINEAERLQASSDASAAALPYADEWGYYYKVYGPYGYVYTTKSKQ